MTAYDTTSETLLTKVIDSGKGITQIEISEIFKMFGKLNRTASQNSEGLGMGLMICDTLVKMNEGTIKVHSDGADCGSEFEFTFKATPHYNSELLTNPTITKKDSGPNKTSKEDCKDLVDTSLHQLEESSEKLLYDLHRVEELH